MPSESKIQTITRQSDTPALYKTQLYSQNIQNRTTLETTLCVGDTYDAPAHEKIIYWYLGNTIKKNNFSQSS